MTKITTQEKANAVVKNLPASGYKMGDKFTLTVGDIIAQHDTRDYYSGRGAKYNSSIRHGNINVAMTERELNKAYKPITARIRFKKKMDLENKKFAKKCKNFSFVCELAAEQIKVVGRTNKENGPKNYNWEGNENYADSTNLSHYSGCGVYRTGWKNGIMTCTLYGGFHNSCPYDCISQNVWIEAVTIEMKKHADFIIKMDGSGTEFFFRNMEDADQVTNATEIYYVPSSKGGLHLNIQPAFAEIVTQKQISNA